ncbi:MAG: hypothetical protein K2W85_05665 [Phycisphaerales bacterium]|nr:hypothetical protein [Phycisphaerales bacterium]
MPFVLGQPMPHELFADDVPFAAHAISRDLPRDQALGLRLIALAKAAAGMHMGQVALNASGPMRTTNPDRGASPDTDAQMLRSQASRLFDLTQGEPR